jgi:hypothetical protein
LPKVYNLGNAELFKKSNLESKGKKGIMKKKDIMKKKASKLLAPHDLYKVVTAQVRSSQIKNFPRI